MLNSVLLAVLNTHVLDCVAVSKCRCCDSMATLALADPLAAQAKQAQHAAWQTWLSEANQQMRHAQASAGNEQP